MIPVREVRVAAESPFTGELADLGLALERQRALLGELGRRLRPRLIPKADLAENPASLYFRIPFEGEIYLVKAVALRN